MFIIKIEGGSDLAKRLDALPKRLSTKLKRQALTTAAEPIRRAAAGNAPRGDRIPHLADNIVVSAAKPQNSGDLSVAIGPSKAVFWGFYQEVGTRHQSARAFLRPAFDGRSEVAVRIVGQALWDALKGSASASPGGVGNL